MFTPYYLSSCAFCHLFSLSTIDSHQWEPFVAVAVQLHLSHFFDEWELDAKTICDAWANKGDTVIGSDVWIGYEAVIMPGVKIGDGVIIGTRAVVTKDVPPYTIVGGVPSKPIRRRFDDDTIKKLEALRRWDWDHEKIRRSIPAIQSGDVAALERAE